MNPPRGVTAIGHSTQPLSENTRDTAAARSVCIPGFADAWVRAHVKFALRNHLKVRPARRRLSACVANAGARFSFQSSRLKGMTLRRTLAVCVATLIAGALAVARPGNAQQSQGPIAPKPGAPVQQPPEGTIRVRVALVRAPVVVVDSKGEPVLDLQQ